MGEATFDYDFDFFPKVVVNHLGKMHYAFCVCLLSVSELLVYVIFVTVGSLWQMLHSSFYFI